MSWVVYKWKTKLPSPVTSVVRREVAVERCLTRRSFDIAMDALDVRNLVHEQINGRWEESNSHSVDLRTALVTPTRTVMTLRLVRKGKSKNTTVNVWIVLEETPDGDGYTIFYDEDRDEFGLAAKGFPDDRHPVVCGYYADFWNAFKGM